jgi:hypothetical protein
MRPSLFFSELNRKFDEEGGGKSSRFQAENSVEPQKPIVNGLSPARISPVGSLNLAPDPSAKHARAIYFCFQFFVTDFAKENTE